MFTKAEHAISLFLYSLNAVSKPASRNQINRSLWLFLYLLLVFPPNPVLDGMRDTATFLRVVGSELVQPTYSIAPCSVVPIFFCSFKREPPYVLILGFLKYTYKYFNIFEFPYFVFIQKYRISLFGCLGFSVSYNRFSLVFTVVLESFSHRNGFRLIQLCWFGRHWWIGLFPHEASPMGRSLSPWTSALIGSWVVVGGC